MLNLRTLVWYFYKPMLIWNMAFSIICVILIDIYSTKVNSFVFFFKLMGYASALFLISQTAKNTYMYYRNAGYSIRQMYACVFSIDFFIYIVMLSLYLICKP